MEEQLSFDLGSLPKPEVTYFALRPDTVAARAAVDLALRLRDRHGLAGCPYGADRLHVSLGPATSRQGFRKDDTVAAMRAAARVAAEPFAVTFDRISTFRGGATRPVVLCCEGGIAKLAVLRAALRRELVNEGLWPGPAQFQPHLTLLWDKRGVPDAHLEKPIRWTVEAFVLVRSLIGRGRQVDLGQWPLRGPRMVGRRRR